MFQLAPVMNSVH